MTISVPFDEHNGSPVYNGTAGELRATRWGEIDWNQIDTFYNQLFPAGVGQYGPPPELLPGSNVLYADSVKFEPLFDEALMNGQGGAGRTCDANVQANYEKAKVTIEYKTIPYSGGGGGGTNLAPVFSRRVNSSTEFLVIPGIGLRWKEDKVSIENDEARPGKLISQIEHEMTVTRVFSPPYSQMRSLAGKVNSTAFEGAEPGTVLFATFSMEQQVAGIGLFKPWTITLKFLERLVNDNGGVVVTWNHVYRATKGLWKPVETSNGDPLYPSGDLNQLLQ